MVVYKSDIKRRYRDGSNCVESLPKRAKVHAQRKFAQGLSSSNVTEKTFVKEKEKVKPNSNNERTPLLSADRPKTEDFLTFLCFRGTQSLPTRLDFFNMASSSDNTNASPSTSNQAANEMLKAKKEKMRGKHYAVKIHPNKFKEKARKANTPASRMDVKRRSNRQAQVIRRQLVTVRRTPRSVTRRPINSAIHRRIGDKRMRAGLRSGGSLPDGSEVGLSTFRRPRSSSSSQTVTVTYPVRKSAIPLGDTSDDEDVEEEEEEDQEDGEEDRDKYEKEKVKQTVVSKKVVKEEKHLRSRTRTRSSSLKSHPSPSNSLKQLPSRKTKEAATAYMEMLSKSLRSPDIESDSYDEAEDPANLEKVTKKIRKAPVREINLPKKIVSKKVLPGRSLKDKCLKRTTLISQRKLIGKNLRIKRVEEITRKRTRSRVEVENVNKSTRPQRSRANQSKINLEEEDDEEEENDEDESDDDDDKEELSVSKKNDLKNNSQKKSQNENPLPERRSRRFIKEDESDCAVKKPLNKHKVIKKQTKRTAAPSPENPQETRQSRRNKVIEPVSNLDVKSSPSRLRKHDKTEVKAELETQTEVRNSPARLVQRRKVGKNDIKVEKVSDVPPVTGRRSIVKKEIKMEDEKVTKSSPSRLRNQVKTANKDNKDSIKTEPESKNISAASQRQTKSSTKKDLKTEPLVSEAKCSSGRSLRKTSSLDKTSVPDENPKSTQKSRLSNDNNCSKKNGLEMKSKISISKVEESNEHVDNNSKMVLAEEPVGKSTRNSRSSSTATVKENNSNKKKLPEKKQESVDSDAPREDEKKPKRVVTKNSDEKPDIEETSIETIQEIKNKKQAGKKQSNVKLKTSSEPSTYEDKPKSPQVQVKSTLEKTDSLNENLSNVKGEVTIKPKIGLRKKNSVASLTDEDLVSNDVPKKKFKQSHNEETESASENVVQDQKLSQKDQNNLTNKDKKDPKKKVSEKKNCLDSEKKPEINTNIDEESKEGGQIVNLALPSVTILNPSREGSIDKLEEKDLKGFDEVNAKEMENKVDKFIEQMILKTSDDESKSKMRSKYKQTGLKDEVSKSKGCNKISASTRTSKEQDKSRTSQEDKPMLIKEESEKVSTTPVSDIAVTINKDSAVESISSDNIGRGRRKSVKQKDKVNENNSKGLTNNDEDKPSKQVSDNKKPVRSPNETKKSANTDATHQKPLTELKELPKTSEINDEVKDDKKKINKKVNIPGEKNDTTNAVSDVKLEKEDSKCVSISASRRTSASSRQSSDTTVSECKVVLENVSRLSDFIKTKKEIPETSTQPVKKASNKKVPETKTRNRGKARAKKAEESISDTSDSDDEPLSKRSAKLRSVKKRNVPAENKSRPRRGARELKALDTSQIPLRTSRARVAKHSSSSFYYETDSSSHYSSSEDEIPVKKVESKVNVKGDMTTQTEDTKDSPKETQPTNTNLKRGKIDASITTAACMKSQSADEKKVVEMPEDLIDFKSDFDGNDVLLMYPGSKDTRHITREEVLSPEDVRNIVKDIKACMPKLTEIPSTSTSVHMSTNSALTEGIKVVIPDHKPTSEMKSMYDEARDSIELLASVAEDISSKMNSTQLVNSSSLITSTTNLPSVVTPQINPSSTNSNNKSDKSTEIEENKTPASSADVAGATKPKPKPSSIGETWIQAFKRAKIPKPGQLSPISHSVKPFVRKPFINQPFVSKQQSPLKCDTPDVKFKPFERSSLIKPHTSSISSSSKLVSLPFKHSSTIPLVKPLSSGIVKDMKNAPTSKSATLNIPTSQVSNLEIKREQKLDNILNQPVLPKPKPLNLSHDSSFRPMEVKSEDSKSLALDDSPREPDPTRRIELIKDRETPGGKHHNLPLAVEHTLRKMSPVAVSRKPVASVTLKPQIQSKDSESKEPKIFDQSKSNRSSPSSGSKSSWLWKPDKCSSDSIVTKASDLELMAKKKVSLTPEEIEKWLDESTITRIKHSEDCGLLEKNQCECNFRTSTNTHPSSLNILGEHSSKVGRSIVEPPVQLKDIEPKCTAETISTCKAEDYKEKLISKSPISFSKENKLETKKDSSSKSKQLTPTKLEKAWKSTRSMTEEEMCEFDFRFERNSNSPRESGSEMSSPTPKDEMSSSNDEGIGSHQSERKSIFQKKNRPMSKSPCAFNAENESSVYAFEPDSDLPVSRPLFRRKNVKSSGEETGRSNSIAVQVYLEPEAVLESSTQTDREEEDGGTTFYIPLRRKSVEPPQMIQGVTVKLDADPDGQEHRVTLRAKLVTKPQADFPRPPPTSRNLGGRSVGKSGKPEQKVRPLSMSDNKPPVGTVQPTLRSPADQIPSTSQESFATSTCSKSSQSTQFSTTPLKLSTDNKATSPLQSNSKSAPDLPLPSRSQNDSGFPRVGMLPKLVEAPAFYPSEKEFSDPLEYLEKITPEAEHYGICRIVPPPSFKPECKVSDDMRFTSYNQYVHKMMRRWGPNVKEMTAIKKYLATQSIALTHPPWIGGMEVDLPRLYQTVQQCGGLKEVIEKKRWTKVADAMKIPKSAQDRVTKLDDIYCKYLLPYDTLSHDERCKLLEQVEHDWEEKERRILLGESTNNSEESDSDSDDGMLECITKGRSMALSQFYRIARNTLWMWFGSEGDPPASEKIESEYWNQVTERMSHVCVNSGSIDCGTWGYGFPVAKTSSTAKHPWNLKVLTNHPQSVLRSLPPLMGVTVPTLHVGMLFSTFCWYRDPHGLPWIEYLHTGANKIWYGVPDEWTSELRGAIKSVLPSIVRESPVWLPSDTAMLPPQLLLDKGVSLCRTVQEPGQFIVIFPKAYTSAICTGYLVSESVYYAPSSWLATAEILFKETKESCEPTMFSLEKLLFFIANDTRSSLEILIQVCPMVESVRNREVRERKELQKIGLESSEKLPKPSKRNSNSQPQEYECNNCRSNLFLSLVSNSNEDTNYCLADALEMLSKDSSQLKYCKLLYLYDEEEMEELVDKIKFKIDQKSQKKSGKGCSNAGSSSKT